MILIPVESAPREGSYEADRRRSQEEGGKVIEADFTLSNFSLLIDAPLHAKQSVNNSKCRQRREANEKSKG